MHQNPARGGREVVDDRVGGQAAGELHGLGRALTTANEDPASADRPREADVALRVADYERSRRIQAEIASGALDEAWRRLATVALPPTRSAWTSRGTSPSGWCRQ